MPLSTLAERLRIQAEMHANFRLSHPPLSHDMVNVLVTAVAQDPSVLPSMDSMDVTASCQVPPLPLPIDATVPGTPPPLSPPLHWYAS